jgi:hypothetical protein
MTDVQSIEKNGSSMLAGAKNITSSVTSQLNGLKSVGQSLQNEAKSLESKCPQGIYLYAIYYT